MTTLISFQAVLSAIIVVALKGMFMQVATSHIFVANFLKLDS